MIALVTASPAHVGIIANRMRPDDVVECRAFGRSPKQALRGALIASIIAYTVKLDGRPIAMLGLTPVSLIEGTGTPWMLGTEDVYRQGRALMRLGPKVIRSFLDSTPRMSNLVSRRNVRAIRVLRAWGFHIEDEVQMIGGVPFLAFRMERA